MTSVLRKKLIEVALPLPEINDASAYDKMPGIGPHPKGIHHWWARLPLPTARAALFASVVTDPSDDPAWRDRGEQEQDAERERLFGIIRRMMGKKLHEHPEVYAEARAEMLKHCDGKLPPVLDPFAGGGSIPLEAARLGFEAHAADLNPVAVLLNKCNLELAPRWANHPPVNQEDRGNLLGTRASRPHKSWNSRGYLPHFDHPGLVQSITFRLADSVPANVVEQWRAELKLTGSEPADDPRCAELRERIEKYADVGKGECWLHKPEIAQVVQDALLHFDGERYRLLAWCVMPNHVHALIETMSGFPLGDVVHSWKSFAAKECNKALKRTGEFWMPDYFDRFIRDGNHLRKALAYIEENPVKAGLCENPEGWAWSSAGRKDAGGTPAFPGMWTGTHGLAADVRYYGRLIRRRAQEKIGHLYPKVHLPKEHGGGEGNVIAWLWARTVASQDPAAKGAHVPLVSSYWLSTKGDNLAWLDPVMDRTNKTYRFDVKSGVPSDKAAVKAGTKLGRGAKFKCLLSGQPIDDGHIKSEGQGERLGHRLLAVVAEIPRGRMYLPANAKQEEAAKAPMPVDVPREEMAIDPRNIWCLGYGLKRFDQLFTSRQLCALAFLSDAVRAIRAEIVKHATASMNKTDAEAYATAVCTFLALAVDRTSDFNNALCTWNSSNQKVMHLFGRQAIPMVWDFAEANTLGDSVGAWSTCADYVADCVETLGARASCPPDKANAGGTPALPGVVTQHDAAQAAGNTPLMVSTDPPYYDNIGYAALSDFFYVWLRRTIGDLYRPLCDTVLVPKMPELTASPERFDGDKEKAKEHFESGFRRTFTHLRERLDRRFPLTVYYAFKQEDEPGSADVSSAQNSNSDNSGQDARDPRGVDLTTGWETLLQALISSGFVITATWPVRASQAWRMVSMGTNALASYIVLACLPRTEAKRIGRAAFVAELKIKLPPALRHLQQGNVAPVDFAQASIGPGMAVFSKYSAVLESNGKPMTVRTALALVNGIKDELLGEAVEELDKDTRWAVTWFSATGFEWGEAGQANLLANAQATAVNGLVAAGIVEVKGNQVRLFRPEELPSDWDPETDKRLTVWEMTHHLVRVYVHEKKGDAPTAALMKKLGSKADVARDLAYKLFTVCENKKWSKEAQSYNALVMGWPELTRLAREVVKSKAQEQGELL